MKLDKLTAAMYTVQGQQTELLKYDPTFCTRLLEEYFRLLKLQPSELNVGHVAGREKLDARLEKV